MAREKGTGNLQREKSGRWTVRVGINGRRLSRSARTTDRDKAERFLNRFLAPLGLGAERLPLADAWHHYEMSPNRRDIAKTTLDTKRSVWMAFAHLHRPPPRRLLPPRMGERQPRTQGHPAHPVQNEEAHAWSAGDDPDPSASVRVEGRSRKSVVASFHSLRHTFVSISANAGVPLPVVQSIVGHCSTAMTRHYYHESENALRQAVEAIPAIGGWEEREEGNSLAAKATKAGTGGISSSPLPVPHSPLPARSASVPARLNDGAEDGAGWYLEAGEDASVNQDT